MLCCFILLPVCPLPCSFSLLLASLLLLVYPLLLSFLSALIPAPSSLSLPSLLISVYTASLLILVFPAFSCLPLPSLLLFVCSFPLSSCLPLSSSPFFLPLSLVLCTPFTCPFYSFHLSFLPLSLILSVPPLLLLSTPYPVPSCLISFPWLHL